MSGHIDDQSASRISSALTAGRRNPLVLAVAQGLFTGALAIDLTLTGLTGYQLAPDKSLATLPFAMITVAGAITSLFASLMMERVGRRAGFTFGAIVGAAGGLVSVWAVIHANFWLFCIGTAGVGIFQSFASFYRLAAADAVDADNKATVISLVLAGGVIAAVIGPAIAAWSKDLFPPLFAGSYLVVFVLCVASALLLGVAYRDTQDWHPSTVIPNAAPRSLAVVFSRPISLAALANNVIGSVVMMFVMTAAPLAAVACSHSIDDGANIIQWHLVGMFAPSFVAGRLITRFGMPAVLYTGMLLSAACGVVAALSTSLLAFYIALLCLGIGWNFMFVGGTTLLAASHLPHERASVQGTSELIRGFFTAIATLAAGPVLEGFGWAELNLAIIPLIIVAALLTYLWVRTGARIAPA
ncbi:Predicted arabinose efflux permease, MFS family [Tardiphaga sp. OK246]|nr:Predicted arabinose efflux permease, MFS family [Tardiphaga sp. OK246]